MRSKTAGVVLAHDRAVARYPGKVATRTQYPLLVVMVAYTVGALLILLGGEVPVPMLIFHQGGWDEVLLFFGAPIVLFVVLRWFGIRRERCEAAEHEDDP